ncbi:hypothetical protein FHS68_003470 [Dyadobacter arcticus]|uniref:Uncharacterized protein n=1 Tax=Dyadobacter arcticus TaxID=1078754 RepID=A0ABX0UMQ3_9BACT|nr:hypothetical protein [Dyadobacter arcticus]
MKEIEFSNSQFQFLIDSFPILRLTLEGKKERFQNNIVFMGNEQIEYLLDGLSNLLSEKGIKRIQSPMNLAILLNL